MANAKTSPRRVGNLFDVKLRAIENLHSAGVDIVPVITIVNGLNNEQVGRVIEFALDNPRKINFLSFQPVSFTGRDEEITDERRHAQRYTLSHLAHDVKKQTGIGEPVRDWFPISFMGAFTDWADVTHGAEKEFGRREGDRTAQDLAKRGQDRWNFLFIAGMWFQDLFNYDFRRTEMCIIPYATQQGEISFCAYNTGIGWRNIIEKMHMTATLTKWYEEHGRHEIFAGGKAVPLASADHSLKLNEEAVRAGAQTDLDDKGIAKNAREEKLKARQAVNHDEMAKLYRQHVLKEEPTLQIRGLGGAKKKQDVQEVLHKPTV